jgi:hypothetical protein
MGKLFNDMTNIAELKKGVKVSIGQTYVSL